MAHKILVVEDERDLREQLAEHLRSNGFDVVECGDGLAALNMFQREKPDLVLLDIMLPGKDGLQICREIKDLYDNPKKMPPILLLTAKGQLEDKEAGYAAGAYDYIVKPWHNEPLVSKINGALVRTTTGANIKIGPLSLDITGHEVRRGDEKVSLTPYEFKLLLALAKEPFRVFKREELLEEVWDIHHYQADTRLVNVHIQRLRSKIEDDPDNPKIVTTVRGVGYKAGQG